VNIVRGFFKIFIGKYEEVLVLEVGADKPGDIASVAKWLKADVVIITAVPEVPVHMEFYPTIRSVLKEKSELVNSLKDGKVLLTGTDDNVSSIGNPYGEVVRVCYESAQVIYEDGIPRGMHFNIAGYGLDALGVLGEHQGYALAFALAAADAFSVNIPKAIIKLEQMTRTAGRMRLIDGQNGSVIIDDSYNSSPEALKAALITLGSLEASGKKIAVLGDMLELGSHSDREHRRAGLQVAHIVDELYTLGAHAEILANSAIDEGLEERKVHMNNISDAIDVGKGIAEKLNTGDVVLIKASQGKIRLEKVVKEIMLDDTKAGELLVRQGDGWN
jgi:UDP-N-acetylmuramoyl-tripeptide--D-alanyl-D-alanine ligase